MTVINMFVFNPRWDMHSLRAKEIKDSPNSQAVPKILALLKNGTVWFHTGALEGRQTDSWTEGSMVRWQTNG